MNKLSLVLSILMGFCLSTVPIIFAIAFNKGQMDWFIMTFWVVFWLVITYSFYEQTKNSGEKENEETCEV